MKARYFAVLALAGLTLGPATSATSQIRQAAAELAKKFEGRSWMHGRIGGADNKSAQSTQVRGLTNAQFDPSKLPFVPGAYQGRSVYLTPSTTGSVVASQGSAAASAIQASSSANAAAMTIPAATATPSAAPAPLGLSRGTAQLAQMPAPVSVPGSVVVEDDMVITSSAAPAPIAPNAAASPLNPVAENLPGRIEPGLSLPAIGVVPEPSTWMMLILGFGLIGASVRRRNTRVSFI